MELGQKFLVIFMEIKNKEKFIINITGKGLLKRLVVRENLLRKKTLPNEEKLEAKIELSPKKWVKLYPGLFKF